MWAGYVARMAPTWISRSPWIGRLALARVLVGALAALAGGPGWWRGHGLVESGAALVSAGQYLTPVRQLVQAVAAEPRDARAHYYLGLAYAGLGQDAAALSHAQDAGRLAPRGARYQGRLS